MANKIKYNLKTRKDNSNPFHGMNHEELLRAAGVKTLKPGEYEIEKLENGRIVVKEKTTGKNPAK